VIYNSLTKKCLYQIPKTGSITARDFLTQNGWVTFDVRGKTKFDSTHITPQECKRLFNGIDGYENYVFIRNPIDRVISAINFLKTTHSVSSVLDEITFHHVNFTKLFKELRREYAVFFKPQVSWVDKDTNILNFDNLKCELCRIAGLTDTNSVPHTNKSTTFFTNPSPEITDFLMREYSDDLLLWDKRCKNTN
jgi:hypothetical protein